MKPFFVVCVDDSTFRPDSPHPVKGDIDKVIKTKPHNGSEWYLLERFSFFLEDGKRWAFRCTEFREVQPDFGEWVESTIMKEVELESVTINK